MNARPDPDTPAAWIERARSDLALSRAAVVTPGVMLEDGVFHAQQCAEKSLKALLIQQRIVFPRTHALEVLLDLLAKDGINLLPGSDDVVILSQYAVETRYPGVWEPITVEEAQQAIKIAARVLSWVESLVGIR
jgi:HEPN domain-containing protein